MGTALSPLDDKFHDWQRRAARYRQLSTLLGEDETAGRLRILALEMEQRLRTFRRAAAAAQARMLDNAILLAEIDTFLARARGASQRLRPLGLSADDLWEESRLFRERSPGIRGCRDAPSLRFAGSRPGGDRRENRQGAQRRRCDASGRRVTPCQRGAAAGAAI